VQWEDIGHLRWPVGHWHTSQPTSGQGAQPRGSGPRPTTYQSAINDVNNAGDIVAVSAGNSNTDASNARPINCNSAIAAGATNRSGVRTFSTAVMEIRIQSRPQHSRVTRRRRVLAHRQLESYAQLVSGREHPEERSQTLRPGHTCTGATTYIMNAYAASLDDKYDAGQHAARG